MKKKVSEIQVGDFVDLDSCPYVNREDHPVIEFEWIEVAGVERETDDCIAISFEGIDQVGYHPDTILEVRPMIVRVTASPHDEDQNLPWEYSDDAFLGWYDEVFRESYKRDVAPTLSVLTAMDALETAGYNVERTPNES
jgi:hypothetical protein